MNEAINAKIEALEKYNQDRQDAEASMLAIMSEIDVLASQYPKAGNRVLLDEYLKKTEGSIFGTPTWKFFLLPTFTPGTLEGGSTIETSNPNEEEQAEKQKRPRKPRTAPQADAPAPVADGDQVGPGDQEAPKDPAWMNVLIEGTRKVGRGIVRAWSSQVGGKLFTEKEIRDRIQDIDNRDRVALVIQFDELMKA